MNRGHVLVCVTGQRTCERLIRAGAELSGGVEGALSVVHVARTGQRFLGSDDEGGALEYLFQVSRDYGADMNVMRSDDVCAAIAAAVKKNNTKLVLMGVSRGGRAKGMHLPEILERMLPGVEIREMLMAGD